MSVEESRLKVISGKKRIELVKILREGFDKQLSTAICRYLVDSVGDTPYRHKQGRTAIPVDVFGQYVDFAEVNEAEARKSIESVFDNESDRASTLRFVCGSYLHGDLDVDTDQRKNLPNLYALVPPPPAPKQHSDISAIWPGGVGGVGNSLNYAEYKTLIEKLKRIALVTGKRDLERMIALRILCQRSKTRAINGLNLYTDLSNEEIHSVSCFDPFLKPVAPGTHSEGEETKAVGENTPRVIRYEFNPKHTNSEFVSNIDDVSPQMKSMLKGAGVGIDEFYGRLSNYERLRDRELKRKFEDDLRKKMKNVSDRFNAIYKDGADGSRYRFIPYLEEDEFRIELRRGKHVMNLENQSTGFMWFFDFFLNVICGDGLRPGDIVIVDEPATGIHAQGQVELRGVMKRFAIENQVTLVMSTHSPFLIDCNFLDEIRIASRHEDDGYVYVENNFQLARGRNPKDESADPIRPVLDALTIKSNIMRGRHTPLVFVEGIVDYNYYAAFAMLFKIDMMFLPVGGVPVADSGSKLLEVEDEPVLLVDADEAGYKAKAETDKRIKVLTLEDIDGNFVGEYNWSNYRGKSRDHKGFSVEDLFSEVDRASILKGRKSSDFSSIFKTYFGEYEPRLSEETKDNFRKVLGRLKEIISGS